MQRCNDIYVPTFVVNMRCVCYQIEANVYQQLVYLKVRMDKF